MKIQVKKTELNKSISLVIGSVDLNSRIPILQNIKLDLSNDFLHLTASNIDTCVKASCPAKVESKGSLAVMAQTFYDVVKKAPKDSMLNLESKDPSFLTVRFGKSIYKIPCLPAEDFPSFIDSKTNTDFNIKSQELIHLIDSTQFAISNDESRYFLTGIFIHYESLQLKAAATNGHKLATAYINLQDFNENFGVIVPKKSIVEIKKLASSYENINIGISENIIKLEAHNILYVSKLIDGDFPQYQNVIPSQNTNIVKIEKSLFFNCLDRISVVAQDIHKSAKLSFSNNKLVITALGCVEEMDIDYLGNPIDIGINSKYLLETIAQINDEFIELNLGVTNSPIVIKSSNAKFVLMPVRI